MPPQQVINLPPLPAIPGHIWRPLHPIDMPALRQLLAECAIIDGEVPARERPIDNIETDTIAAISNQGKIAAYVWLYRENQEAVPYVVVDGRIHPDYRENGIGSALTAWCNIRARAMLTFDSSDKIVFTHPLKD